MKNLQTKIHQSINSYNHFNFEWNANFNREFTHSAGNDLSNTKISPEFF